MDYHFAFPKGIYKNSLTRTIRLSFCYQDRKPKAFCRLYKDNNVSLFYFDSHCSRISRSWGKKWVKIIGGSFWTPTSDKDFGFEVEDFLTWVMKTVAKDKWRLADLGLRHLFTQILLVFARWLENLTYFLDVLEFTDEQNYKATVIMELRFY